jgi:hypothetical protein
MLATTIGSWYGTSYTWVYTWWWHSIYVLVIFPNSSTASFLTVLFMGSMLYQKLQLLFLGNLVYERYLNGCASHNSKGSWLNKFFDHVEWLNGSNVNINCKIANYIHANSRVAELALCWMRLKWHQYWLSGQIKANQYSCLMYAWEGMNLHWTCLPWIFLVIMRNVHIDCPLGEGT